MFVLTYWTLVYRRPNGRPMNFPMLFVAILMFVLATMQLAVNFTRIIRGFVIHEGHTEDYYNVLAEFTQIFGSALYIVQTFVGDAVALYRVYIVWGRRPIFIAFPFMTYLGSLVAGIGILVTMGQANDGSLVFFNKLGRWISSFFSLTLVTSTICTFMIASRIWYLNAQSAKRGSASNLHPVALVVVESGSIYSSLLIALLILYGQKSWFQYIVVDSLSSLIGIVFSVIIVRIGLGIAVDPDTVQGSTLSSKAIGAHRRDNVQELSTFQASDGFSGQSVERSGIAIDLEKSVAGSASSPGGSLKHQKSTVS